jgi:ribulose-phosphate 3-epimerase
VTKLELSASVLALDLSALAEQISALDEAGIDAFHVDIMDGHFVPNLSFGPSVVKAIRAHTKRPLIAHLMVSNPDQWVEELDEAGADRVCVHVEAGVHLHRTLTTIKAFTMECGVAINPGTSLSALDAILPIVDFILIMSVDPGFGGQELVEGAFERAKLIKAQAARAGNARIAMDGGLKEHNLSLASHSGVTRAVVGTGLLAYADFKVAVARLKTAFRGETTVSLPSHSCKVVVPGGGHGDPGYDR